MAKSSALLFAISVAASRLITMKVCFLAQNVLIAMEGFDRRPLAIASLGWIDGVHTNPVIYCIG
ncbi:hypothetical protein [Salinivibrio sp. ES.052]|uniref:hypothetical protein n=1 Tax=Salinivibrio sp. ES.052 TaxID=1882823 RepID=UPI000940D897|nr:hypothetical protein [Salinivibrio sp. ES.052]